jgi:hypothetical protein
MLLVVAAAAWLAVQLKWLHDRHQILLLKFVSSASVDGRAPLPLRLLGEEGVGVIWSSGDQKQNETLRKLFPEAEVLDDPAPPES